MPLPTSSDGQPLIPSHRVQSHGPKRLRPMQGQHLDPKTGLWGPKFKKKSPDPLDRRKLLAKIVEGIMKPAPIEAKPFDWSRYKPVPGRVLLRVGNEVSVKGVVIPDAAKWREQAHTVVAINVRARFGLEFTVGDRVILDRNSHQRPVEIDGEPLVLVKIRRVAAVIQALTSHAPTA